MKIIWSDDNYEIEEKFGEPLVGLKRNNKRPDTLIIKIKEIGSYPYYPGETMNYLLHCKKALDSRNPTILLE